MNIFRNARLFSILECFLRRWHDGRIEIGLKRCYDDELIFDIDSVIYVRLLNGMTPTAISVYVTHRSSSDISAHTV